MLTKPVLGMVKAPGAPDQSEVVVEAGSLESSDAIISNVSEIEDAIYDESTGILTLEFANGQVLRVKGFPTLDSIPPGDKGPEGDAGQDGKEGRPGKEGKPGKQGCQGERGEEGDRGERGDAGKDGNPGEEGGRGCAGPQGARGRKGPKGETGPVGITGPTGDTGPTGPTGDRGPSGTVNIIVSTTDPGPAAGAGTIWVNPNKTDEAQEW